MSLPMVAIVGRPNVGKSSLLNCMVGRRISIVDRMPGVMRDRVSALCALPEQSEEGEAKGEGRRARGEKRNREEKSKERNSKEKTRESLEAQANADTEAEAYDHEAL